MFKRFSKLLWWLVAVCIAVLGTCWMWQMAGPSGSVHKSAEASGAGDNEASVPRSQADGLNPVEDDRRPSPASPLTPAAVREIDLKIEAVLMSGESQLQMAERLSRLLSDVRSSEAVRVVPHLANLTYDEDYEGLVGKHLREGNLPKDALDLLFNDLLNRRQNLQLPLFEAMATEPSHPLNRDVIGILAKMTGVNEPWTKSSEFWRGQVAKMAGQQAAAGEEDE